MKELCCKILAAIFIGLIIASLVGMRREIQGYTHGPHLVQTINNINAFDTVLVGDEKHIGIVEQITNNLYHVVYKDAMNNTIHAIYTRDSLQKVLIVSPHKHE